VPTGCTRPSARWPSARSRRSSATSAPTRRASRSPITWTWTAGSCCTAPPGRPPACTPRGRAPRPPPCSSSARRRSPTTGTTSTSRSSCWRTPSWERHGRSRGCLRPCGTRPTSTSTASARSTWTTGPAAGWCWSGTPPTAPRRWRAWAPAWPWWAPTCWLGSWRPRPAIITRRSPATRKSCGYVGKGQKLAKANAVGLVPRSRSQIWLRNQFLRALPTCPGRDRGRRRPAGGQRHHPQGLRG
jgi:hypothetical protein